VLHTTVGALHATMGVRAALHERIPMVVLAGESIGFAEGAHSVMGRQWLRLLTDVGGPARLMEHCVKWSFGLNTSVILPHTVQRACQLAMAAPKGPVFVSVPTEFLMEAMSADAPPAVLAVPPAAQPAAIEDLARVLSEAKIRSSSRKRRAKAFQQFSPWLQSLSCWARRCSMPAALLRQFPARPSALRRRGRRGHGRGAARGGSGVSRRGGGAMASAVGASGAAHPGRRPGRGPAALQPALLGFRTDLIVRASSTLRLQRSSSS